MASMLNSVIDIAQQRNKSVSDEVNRNVELQNERAKNIGNLITTASNGVQSIMENKVNTDLQEHQMNINALGESIISDDSISIENKLSEYDKQSQEYLANATKDKGAIYTAYFNRYKDELLLSGKEKVANKFVTKLNEYNSEQLQAFIDRQVDALAKGLDIIDVKGLSLYSFDINSNSWLTQFDYATVEDDFKYTSNSTEPAAQDFDRVMNNIYKAARGVYNPEKAKNFINDNAHKIELAVMTSQISDAANRKIQQEGVTLEDAIVSLSFGDIGRKTLFTNSEMTADEVADYNNTVKSKVKQAWEDACISEEQKYDNLEIGKKFTEADADEEGLTLDEFNSITSSLKPKFLSEETNKTLDYMKDAARHNSLRLATIDLRSDKVFNTDVSAICTELGLDQDGLAGYINGLSETEADVPVAKTGIPSAGYLEGMTAQVAFILPMEFSDESAYTDYDIGKIVIDGYEGSDTNAEGRTGALNILLDTARTQYAGDEEVLKKFDSLSSWITTYSTNPDVSNYDRLKVICNDFESWGIQIVSDDGNLVLNESKEFFDWAIQKGKASVLNYASDIYDKYNGFNPDNKKDFLSELATAQGNTGKEVDYVINNWRVNKSVEGHSYDDYAKLLWVKKFDGTGYEISDIVARAMGDSLMSDSDFERLKKLTKKSETFESVEGATAQIEEKAMEIAKKVHGNDVSDKVLTSVLNSAFEYVLNNPNANTEKALFDFEVQYTQEINEANEKTVRNGSKVQYKPNSKEYLNTFDGDENFWGQETIFSPETKRMTADYFQRFDTRENTTLLYSDLTDTQRKALSLSEAFGYLEITDGVYKLDEILGKSDKELNAYFKSLADKIDNSAILEGSFNLATDIAKGIYQTSKSINALCKLSESAGYGDALKPVKIDTNGVAYFLNGAMANPVKVNGKPTYQLIDKNGQEICPDMLKEFDTDKSFKDVKKLKIETTQFLPLIYKNWKNVLQIPNSRVLEPALVEISEVILSDITSSKEYKSHKTAFSELGIDIPLHINVYYSMTSEGNIAQYMTVTRNKYGDDSVCSFYFNNKPIGEYSNETGGISYAEKAQFNVSHSIKREGDINGDAVADNLAKLNIN